MSKDIVKIEELEEIRDFFNKQEGRKYPCSNQIVLCGIVTDDKEKAIEFMKDKPVVEKREYDRGKEIMWFLDNGEKWLWRTWNESCRGYRFYKVAVDKNISKELLDFFIMPYASMYCCSFEII